MTAAAKEDEMKYGPGITLKYDARSDNFIRLGGRYPLALCRVALSGRRRLKRKNLKLIAYDQPGKGRMEVRISDKSRFTVGRLLLFKGAASAWVHNSYLHLLGIDPSYDRYFWIEVKQ